MDNQYRVWCKNKNEWEKDEIALFPNGYLYDLRHRLVMRPENHIVCKCSGLPDKNDKLIFEGDIIKLEDRIVKVVWFSPQACFDIEVIKIIGDYRFNKTGWNISDMSRWEIIGNIHENPELLA